MSTGCCNGPGLSAHPPRVELAPMSAAPLQFLLLLFAGWVNRRQQAVIDYLIEENRVLREQLRGRRMWFTDDQRRRLARKGRLLARRVLDSLNTIVTPNTILRWYRERDEPAKTIEGPLGDGQRAEVADEPATGSMTRPGASARRSARRSASTDSARVAQASLA